MTLEISLSRPDITEKEINAVMEVLRTHTLSIGPKVDEFERILSGFVGARYGIAVNSGTSGLHLLIRSLGLAEGDEVITTSFSFVASSNCILFEGATPVFADIESKSLNIDPGDIEARITSRTKAILPVHVFGEPAEMDAIMEIAARHNLAVIEDACEALGAEYRGKKAGTFGAGSVFAFYPNKQITTGEGGMIVTDDPDIARRCRSMRNQGRGENSTWLEHERLGYNYRMDELSASLGVAQMERIDEILAKRAMVADIYNKKLKSISGVQVPYQSSGSKNSRFVYVVRLEPSLKRDDIMLYLQKHGVQCKPYFSPIHLQQYYRDIFGYRGGELPVTEAVSNQTLALPFYNNLTELEIDYTVSVLKDAVKKFG